MLAGPDPLARRPLAFAGPTSTGTVVAVAATDAMRWSDGLKPEDAPAPVGGGDGGDYIDTFTGAAGTNLADHAPDGGGSWASADTISPGSNAVLTAAGRVRADAYSATPASIFYWTSSPPSGDYSVSADVYVADGDGQGGVIARCTPEAGSYAAAIYDAIFNRVMLMDGGTQVAAHDVAWAVGSTHRIELTVVDGFASVAVDGSEVISMATIFATGGYAGVIFPIGGSNGLSDSTLVHLDDFGTSFATAPPPASVVYGISPETIQPLDGDAAWLREVHGKLSASLSARDLGGFADSLAFVVVAGPTLISASDRFGWSSGSALGATLSARDLAAFVERIAPPSLLLSARDSFSYLDASGPIAASVGGWDRFAIEEVAGLAAAVGGGDRFTTGDGGNPLVLLGTQSRVDFDRIAFADRAAVVIAIGDLDAFAFFDQSAASVLLSGSDGFSGWSEAAIAGLAPFAVASIDSAGFQASSALQAAPVGADSLAWLASTAIGVGVSSLDAFAVVDLASISLTVTALDSFSFLDDAAWRAFTASLVYNIYANEGDGGPIDYSSALATVDGLEWTSDPLPADSDWWFAVRVYSVATGLEESNIDAAVHVLIDHDRHDVSARPDPPTAIRASALAGGMVRVEWSDKRPAGTSRATGYRVYQGVGSVDWTTPVADVPASGGIAGAYYTVVGPLANGTVYAFGVRAYNASAEEANVSQATATADAEGPAAVGGFSIGLTSES